MYLKLIDTPVGCPLGGVSSPPAVVWFSDDVLIDGWSQNDVRSDLSMCATFLSIQPTYVHGNDHASELRTMLQKLKLQLKARWHPLSWEAT